MFNTAARAVAIARRESSASISDAAVTYIKKFRDQPKMVKYIQTKWQQAKRKKKWKFITRPISLGRKIAFDFLYPGKSRDSALRPTVFERLVSSKRRHTMARLQKRFFKTFDEAALEAMKYIYFPMHKETDLTLSFQATSWLDQRNTVSLLASCLPAGHKLLVREHRFNYGDRPSRYYREMSRLPNVVLIDAYDPQFKYIRHADLIITENGSSGWEGQLLGRRVINLASTFYDGTRGARKLEKIDQLGPTILEALANPAVQDQAKHDLALGRMIDAEMATTFPLPPDDDRMGLERLAVTLVPLLRRTSSSPGVVPHRPASAPRLAGHQVSQQN